MEWIPLRPPKPEDGKHYDIQLNNGEVIFNVLFWDFGGGFEPLELDENVSEQTCHVRYSISDVAAFRPISERIE